MVGSMLLPNHLGESWQHFVQALLAHWKIINIKSFSHIRIFWWLPLTSHVRFVENLLSGAVNVEVWSPSWPREEISPFTILFILLHGRLIMKAVQIELKDFARVHLREVQEGDATIQRWFSSSLVIFVPFLKSREFSPPLLTSNKLWMKCAPLWSTVCIFGCNTNGTFFNFSI